MKLRNSAGRAAALLIIYLVLAPVAAAQNATPVASPSPVASPAPSGRPDLAAMALDSRDIPAEFGYFGESYLRGEDVGEVLTGGKIPQSELDETGLRWYYESIYSTPDGSTTIRSYLEEYADELGAARGFEVLEDEARLVPDTAVFKDSPGPGIGEEPSEISEGSLNPSIGDPEVQTVDVTFRVGRIIAGVSVDTAPGVEADRDLAIDLSRRLEERISAVLGGESLDLIDLTLPGQLATLGSGWTGRNEGYLSSAELLGSELGPEFEPAFVTGYFRVTVMGDPSVGFPLPALNIAVARFADEAGPLSLMSRLDEFQAQFVGLERVTIDRIPGTSAAVAFKYANPAVAGSDIDSFRVLMVVDSSLVTLDIQGNATIEGAQEAALKIAEAQAACLGSASDCPPLTLAEGLLAPPSNPGSEPVG